MSESTRGTISKPPRSRRCPLGGAQPKTSKRTAANVSRKARSEHARKKCTAWVLCHPDTPGISISGHFAAHCPLNYLKLRLFKFDVLLLGKTSHWKFASSSQDIPLLKLDIRQLTTMPGSLHFLYSHPIRLHYSIRCWLGGAKYPTAARHLFLLPSLLLVRQSLIVHFPMHILTEACLHAHRVLSKSGRWVIWCDFSRRSCAHVM